MEAEKASVKKQAMSFDEISMEKSKSFITELQELKNLRPQLYSAAEYCEKSYLNSDEKQIYKEEVLNPNKKDCQGEPEEAPEKWAFLLLFSKRKVPDRALNILGILVFWTWFPLLVSCLPNWTERVFFMLASFCACAIQHVQFTLNHFAADTYIGAPKGNDWFEKQISGTIDISCLPKMDWFFGGLQFQLEHHLFPRMPRCHLRSISPVVQELCKKHNLPYRSLSFFEANMVTIQTLRTAAMEARDLTMPVPKNLLWEAVNIYG